ncbi:DUF6251 family protein [Streptomyces sp. NPDC087422]|uniref:DUF6251 family protein n=1 Tax=Streptomyces sp. NPDC087422 TaxID=3365786 RepID=UPI00380D2099
MSEISKAAAEVVAATRQSEDYAVMLAAVQAEMAQRQQAGTTVHIHQAAQPDRTIQRLALGAGLGAGAVAGAVYFGPLLIASLTTMAVIVLAGALAIAVLAWAIVHVVTGVRPEPKGKRR